MTKKTCKALASLFKDDDPITQKKLDIQLTSFSYQDLSALKVFFLANDALLYNLRFKKILREAYFKELSQNFLIKQQKKKSTLRQYAYFIASIGNENFSSRKTDAKLTLLSELFQDYCCQFSLEKKSILLANFLGEECNFKGTSTSYYKLENNFIDYTLDNNIGNPLTISLIYILVAKRNKLNIQGIALPGHFIVGDFSDDEPLYFDPFKKGKQLSLDDCKELVEQQGLNFHKNALKQATNEQIFKRMILNIENGYTRKGQSFDSELIRNFFNQWKTTL